MAKRSYVRQNARIPVHGWRLGIVSCVMRAINDAPQSEPHLMDLWRYKINSPVIWDAVRDNMKWVER